MFLLNSNDIGIKNLYSVFTIQNVSIKLLAMLGPFLMKWYLQYKMFLLNTCFASFKGNINIFTIQNVSIKYLNRKNKI